MEFALDLRHTKWTFTLWQEAGQLLIGAEGQDAINLLIPITDATLNLLEQPTKLTLDLIQAVSKRGCQCPFQQTFTALEEQYGVFQGFNLLWTQPLTPSVNIVSVYLPLRFERGTSVFRWVCLAKTLSGFIFNSLTSCQSQSICDSTPLCYT